MDEKITITVQTEYRADASDPASGRYAFAYHISIANAGTEPAQLISRHWIITDGNQKNEEVRGLGVVGQQPRILPGAAHRYSSGAVLPTAVGSMTGSYQFVRDDGRVFQVPIPAFRLAVPSALN
jgi:ApaG protein